MRAGVRGTCQMRRVSVTSPEPPQCTASPDPPKPPSETTSGPSSSKPGAGDPYAKSAKPPQVHNSRPVLGSNAATRRARLHTISSRLLARAITGVVHDPKKSERTAPSSRLGSSPALLTSSAGKRGANSTFHSVLPLAASIATRKDGSPGPKLRITKPPWRMGDEP